MDFSSSLRCPISEISTGSNPPLLRSLRRPFPSSGISSARFSPSPFPISCILSVPQCRQILPVVSATGGGDNDSIPPNGRGGGGKHTGGNSSGNGDEDEGENDDESDAVDEQEQKVQKSEENAGRRNKEEAMKVLEEEGRALDSLPEDVAAAIEEGRLPGSVVKRFFELENSGWLFKWLMQFGGFKERLLADDLFLAKVAMECGVGIFTKTAAEYERRRENFFKELEIVFADVVMAIIADFMLVYLPAPTVSLRPAVAVNAGAISKFFANSPDNAFQVALAGTSYTLLQRLAAVVRNGAKLFAVGTTSSLVGTSVTNLLIKAKKTLGDHSEDEEEKVPILSTSVAYGVYMAVSSNLRYQILAGVIEQRFLEPLFHQQKLILSALCFAVRTGNTFLGSLLWVDYARWVGVQKSQEEH